MIRSAERLASILKLGAAWFFFLTALPITVPVTVTNSLVKISSVSYVFGFVSIGLDNQTLGLVVPALHTELHM